MSKLDEMKKNYENIEIPEELKERVEKGISEGKQASKHRILPFTKGKKRRCDRRLPTVLLP